jgi:hypothetical protein
MRKSNLLSNHDPFDRAIARYRSFTERVLSAQRVIRSQLEKRDLAESVLLRLCANWERFIDEHLIDCVNRDPSMLSDYLGVKVPVHPTRDLCHGLLFGGGFKDFKSFGDLKGFSKKVLPELSNPFLAVRSSRIRVLDNAFKIRNYLAHYSAASRRSLNRLYKGDFKLKRFVEPGQFLTAYDGKRLWAIFDGFEGASSDMKDWYISNAS